MSSRVQKSFRQKSSLALAAAICASVALVAPAAAQRDSVEYLSADAVGPSRAAPSPRATAGPGGRFEQPLVSHAEPMYVVRAIDFEANDESDYDWLGSDEVYGIWGAGNSFAGTSVFGNVDTGDRRSFRSGQNCIYPMDTAGYIDGRGGDRWGCIPTGAPGPIEFHLSLWESDGFQLFPVCFDGGIRPEPDCEDDVLGSMTTRHSERELAAAMPEVGDTMVVEYELLPCRPGATFCSTNPRSPDYSVRYEVRRVNDRDLSERVKE